MLRPLTDQEPIFIPYQRRYYFDHICLSILLNIPETNYIKIFYKLSTILITIFNFTNLDEWGIM